MTSYKIAIPSYKRSTIITERTLPYLQECNVDESSVYIFVSNEAEGADYREALAGTDYNIVVPATPIQNVTEKFNYLHSYFEDGERVFVLEDDIKELVKITRTDNKPKHLGNLDFVERGFEFCEKAKTKIFGIIPHDNGFYMKMDVSVNLKLIVAHAYGFIADSDPALLVTQIGKSDYERSILYFLKFGAVVRFNYVGVRTNSYKTEGGMDKDNRVRHEKESCDYLVRRYPHFIKHNTKKESMYAELSFVSNVKRDMNLWASVQQITDEKLGY